MMSMMQIVLGAGLAGLSLAVALVREGVGEPIVVVDRRTEFGRDRTWCTWAAPDTPFLDLATHRWDTWEVRTETGSARATSKSRAYVHIPSDAFYAAALEELERAPNVELRLGVTVREIGDGWARTDAGELRGLVHDGLALGSPVVRTRERSSRSHVALWQAFLGWEVETEVPTFDPDVATLMDYRTPQLPDGVQFVYVLPYSPTRALVEHTSFAPGGPTPDERRDVLRDYLPDAYAILGEERGRLPMTTEPFAALRSPRTTAIGIAGGALRPSSGYAFSRVQAHSRALARAIRTGAPLPRHAASRRRAALDTVFLHALAADPGAFPEHFRTLVADVPADAFARFMSDHSSPADEARVMAALPSLPFARAALSAAASRTARRTPR